MEALCGTWKLVKSENFKEYLRAIGLEEEVVQAGNVLKPTFTFSQDGDNVVMKTVTNFFDNRISAKLNEEFDEVTIDNRNCKSVLYLEGGKLVQVQKWNDKQAIITREVKGDQMILMLDFDGTVAVRTYERV